MVALHERVFASGLPNYRGLRIPLVSKLTFLGGGLILVRIMTILSLTILSSAGQLVMITDSSVFRLANYAITLAPRTIHVI